MTCSDKTRFCGVCGVGCGMCEKGGIRDDSKVSSLKNWNTGAVLTQMDGN